MLAAPLSAPGDSAGNGRSVFFDLPIGGVNRVRGIFRLSITPTAKIPGTPVEGASECAAEVGAVAKAASLGELDLPLVWLNHLPSIPDSSAVISDESAAVTEMCRHLAALGHRRIAFLTLDYEHYSAGHRKAEIERAARETGLDLAVIRTNESFEQSSIRKTVNCFLDEHFPRRTAAVCYNREFMQVLRFEAAKRGIPVPERLSVCHFISIFERQILMEFPLSGVMLPEERMAREALKRMDLLAAGHPGGGPPVAVPATFVVGESTVTAPED